MKHRTELTPTGGRGRRVLAAAAATAVALTLAACGDDDAADDDAASGTAAAVDDGVLTVTMVDFAYQNVPDEVPAGTRIEVVNESDDEVHEVVAVKLPEGDERPVAEIVPDGLGELMAGGPPAMVLVAPPGGDQVAAVGDGTLSEPGRYVLFCSIPTGADPEEFMAAAAEGGDGPPDVEGGPPHFTQGMVTDLVVTET